jgi:acyl-CoA hydrolase
MRETDRRIAEYVAERIPDGATLQAGIGAISDEVLSLLGDNSNLGVHTELLSDGFVYLVEQAVITGANKSTHPKFRDGLSRNASEMGYA